MLPDKLISLTKMWVEGSKSKVKIDNVYSDTFWTHTGGIQEDGLSLIIFNITLEGRTVQRTKNIQAEIRVRSKVNTIFFYITFYQWHNQKMGLCKLAKTETNKNGLKINNDKSK